MSDESCVVGPTAIPSSVFIISSDGRTVKLPIPSTSLRDPLNWSLLKRSLAFFCLLFFAITSLVQTLGRSVMLPTLMKEYQQSDMGPFSIEVLISGGTLFIGLGAFLLVPLSLAIGRRPVLLICNIILVIGTVWATISKSFWQHLVAVCLQGFALSIAPSLVILIIVDLTFVHERATVISLFSTLCGLCSNPLIVAIPILVKEFDTWRALYAVGIAPAVVSLFAAFFFFPETYFVRPSVAFDGMVLEQSSTEQVLIYSGWSDMTEERALPDLPSSSVRLRFAELKFWGITPGGFQAMKHSYPQILLSFFNPLVIWVMLLKTLILGCFVSFSVTFAELLTKPPYNVPIEKLALTYLPAILASLLSFPLSGPIMSRISLNLASHNGGRHLPEHYLAGFIIPVLLGTGGQVLYGFAGAYHLPLWTIFVAYGMISLSFISLYTVTALWSTEVFPRWAAPCVTVVSGGAYLLSFVLSWSIVPWIKHDGFIKANCELAGLFFLVGCGGIPIAIWGTRFRGYVEHRWGESEAGALRPH